MSEKLTRFTNKIEILTHFVNDALLKIEQKREDQPHAFLYSLAFKTNNGLNTANRLIANVLTRRQYSDSLFLLLRTMLADTITYFYLMTISRDKIEYDDNILIENIRRMEFDHIKFMYRSLHIYQKLHNEPEQNTEQKKAVIRSQYPMYFNADGGFKKSDKMDSINEMVLKIAKTNLEFVKKPIGVAYSLYDKYSKYEHLGMLTPFLIVRQFDVENEKEILNEIYHAISTILLSQSSLVIPFFTKDEKLRFDTLHNEILELDIWEA